MLPRLPLARTIPARCSFTSAAKMGALIPRARGTEPVHQGLVGEAAGLQGVDDLLLALPKLRCATVPRFCSIRALVGRRRDCPRDSRNARRPGLGLRDFTTTVWILL